MPRRNPPYFLGVSDAMQNIEKLVESQLDRLAEREGRPPRLAVVGIPPEGEPVTLSAEF